MRTARGFSPTTRPDADPGGQAPLSEEFVARVAAAQRPLFAYIRSLVGPWAEPEDILQEVNLVLCRKAREFDHGPYLTWACRVAYLQFLAHLKRHRRERHRFLDELLLAEMADTLAERVEQLDDRLDALRRCVAKLSPAHRRMITARYAGGGSVQAVAEAEGRPASSVRVTLHRIRLLLLGCVERSLTEGGAR